MTDMQYLGIMTMIQALVRAEAKSGKSADEIAASVDELVNTLKKVKKEESSEPN